jgi:predicted phage terminase large subunit-like protein
LGKNSYTKRAPKAVMAASREAARNFLGAYWSCDGGIDVRASRSRGSIYRAYATTVSRKLAEDLLHLLGLVGIEARLRAKARALETAAQPGGVYRSFTIDVGSEAMTARVVRLPGMSSVKRTRGEACQIDFDRPIWNDTIVSIGIDEPARCMCLTVAEDHSFTCSGIAVKNCMKSLLVGVLWPAWEWGPRGLKHLRYLGTAHKQDLATRDNMKCRRLVSSKWFQERWPIVLMNDNNAKLRFENSATGFREAMAFTSMTGSRGDRVILDDPLSVDDADSEAALKAAELTFTEALPTRVNSEQSAKIVIMQRLHERDTSGVILSRALDYVHLMLPMEFEPERRCVTSIGFSDPRKAAGELLFPERFGPEQVADLKRTMGQYAVSGQFQQRPAPRDGGRFKRQWFEVVDALPANRRRVRRWDFAGTEATQGTDPDWTVGLLMSAANGVYYVEDVVRDRCSPAGVETMVRNTATADGKAVPIRIPQDPGAAGKSVALSFVKALAGWDIRAKTETGSKTDRARPLEAQAEAGNVKLLRGHWNQVFLDELCVFPGGAHDDQVDAASGAFAELLETPPTPLFGTYGND